MIRRQGRPISTTRVAAGREAIVNEFACIDCHKFRDDGELGLAPDLTGYASREWLTAFISNPAARAVLSATRTTACRRSRRTPTIRLRTG